MCIFARIYHYDFSLLRKAHTRDEGIAVREILSYKRRSRKG